MPAQLVALTSGPDILLDKPILLLGRHPECDIQIDSRKISRRHCCVAQVSDYLVVRDLGSTNGIRINGVRVVEGRLTDGDELTLGNNRYQVRWDAAGHEPPPRARLNRDTGRAPVDSLSDDVLESSDEPIPLDEAGLPKVLPRRAPPVPDISQSLSASFEVPEEKSVILPDNLELRPRSDVFPGVGNPPPSDSRPPN
jgi:predicted component of type VI protein secretion system